MSELNNMIYYLSSDIKREIKQLTEIVDYLVYESDIDKLHVLAPVVHKALVETVKLTD